MASLNRVFLMGNLTRDPEVRFTPAGTAVADLALAVNERQKNQQGEWTEVAHFFDVTVWGRTAELCGQYLAKGRPVMVEGRLQLDTWETKEGEKRNKVKVVGERVQFLGGAPGASGGTGGGQAARPVAAAAPSNPPPAAPPMSASAEEDEDLPF